MPQVNQSFQWTDSSMLQMMDGTFIGGRMVEACQQETSGHLQLRNEQYLHLVVVIYGAVI